MSPVRGPARRDEVTGRELAHVPSSANEVDECFPKKLENLTDSLWLYFARYNFVRTHATLRVTAAMAAGGTDHICSAEEFLNAAPCTGA